MINAHRRRLGVSIRLISLAFLLSCTPDGDGLVRLERDGPALDATPEFATIVSGAGGITQLVVPVLEGETNLLVTATADAPIRLNTITDPDGEEHLAYTQWELSDNALTDAVFADAKDVSINWPIRIQDAPLSPGDWTLTFGVRPKLKTAHNRPVQFNAQFNRDEDLDSGTIRIALGYGGDLGTVTEVTQAVDAATEIWASIWEDYGLAFELRPIDVALDAQLPYPEKDPALEAVAASLGSDEVLLLIGDQIGGEGDLLGIAGATPGTLLATPRAAVMVSWLEGAGPDAVFSDSEIQLLGETLAHELGHYMGLYHPVEFDYDAWDALEDTVDCTGQADCERILKNNLMFPYPVCEAGNENSCVQQRQLTEQQQGVMHRYTGTR